MLSNMHTSVSSGGFSDLTTNRKSMIENTVHSPLPVKRKTLV